MGLSSGFQDGLVFASDDFFLRQGAYTYPPKRPAVCDKCLSESGCFHAHGRYKRSVKTMKNMVLTRIQIWKNRWLCLCCGRTRSTGPPDVLPYIPLCTLVVVALLWVYLDGRKGIHNCIQVDLNEAASLSKGKGGRS